MIAQIQNNIFSSLLSGLGQVRWLVLVAVAWFLFFFNLERLDYDDIPLVNFSNSTYVAALVIAVLLLLFPTLERMKFYILTLFTFAIFIIISLIFTKDRLLAFDYHVGADFLALIITVYIVRRISRLLLYYELSVQSLVFDRRYSRVQPFKEIQTHIQEELQRNQHFSHPMAVIYCQIYYASNPFGTAAHQILDNDITLPLERRYDQVRLGKSIGNLVYSSDFVAEYGDDILICLPETDAASANHFIQLVQVFIKHQHNLEIRAGIALSNQDGDYLEELIQTAQTRVQLLNPQEGDPSTSKRLGDVLLEVDELLKIESAAQWVNDMPYPSPLERRLYRPIKRLMDIAAIMVVSPFLLPVFAVLALLIFLEDRGSVFYMQNRTGLGGKRFQMFKFRSMKMNAATMPAKKVTLPNGEVRYEWPDKTEADPRITRIGHFIRKTSIDELPQLLNVLRGDMSLVGPRPTTWDVGMYTLHQTERLTVHPGLTGLWQVSARESKNFDERLVWDKKYVEKISITLDIIILWKTVSQVTKKGGV